jgi:transcription initiation factor TFIIB
MSNACRTKTQKIKKTLTHVEKRVLWKQFTEQLEPTVAAPPPPEDICYKCGHPLVTMDDSFPTCTNTQCSIIYNDVLDHSPEWRFYGAEDKHTVDPTRCGNPINPLLHESSFGCQVLCGPRASYEMKKIQKWTEWQSMPHKEKALYDEFQFISNMAQNAGIPKIFIEDAMIIHKKISGQRIFRGWNRDGIKAASIYIACRKNGSPRTAHEIAKIFCLDKAGATNGCSVARTILNKVEYDDDQECKEMCNILPSLFIERFCSSLHINAELTVLAKFICQKIEREKVINDNTPHAVAAGVIYFVAENCNLGISKTSIKNITGISEVTVSKCYQKLVQYVQNGHQLIPMMILDKYARAKET